jgi:hypothetical protein
LTADDERTRVSFFRRSSTTAQAADYSRGPSIRAFGAPLRIAEV